MLIGKIDAAYHVVALPDHPHLLGRLDEIERLDRIEQLPGNAARITSPLGGERKAPLAAEHLVIRNLHLSGGPGLEDWILDVADRRRHLPGAIQVAVKRMGGILRDRTVPDARRRIEKTADTDPSEAIPAQCRYSGRFRGCRNAPRFKNDTHRQSRGDRAKQYF